MDRSKDSRLVTDLARVRLAGEEEGLLEVAARVPLVLAAVGDAGQRALRPREPCRPLDVALIPDSQGLFIH